ncbi:hypothetical protein Cgig2_000323 [Carnegiea gigantea]|uniref:Uncharacterized protein n=1 Tax=Carnegiea gigantea TaxID=171969 RepID=A0A9Q1GSN9_9CARY|nr:hypothetical protein Cgig2_000323 [Carnegiea gigantea]
MGVNFMFSGLSNFMTGVIEWTKYVLKHFEHTLRSANIYGIVGPLTNTLYQGVREVGISLYDLERIGGLPILGDVYNEFSPHNEDLMDDEKFSPMVLELLLIHAELYRFHYSSHSAFHKELEKRTSFSPLQISQTDYPSTLNVMKIFELVAFLPSWLSRFVPPITMK